MFSQLFSIFFNVVTPVFALILTAYLLGNRLGIHSRSLSRTAYYLLVPAFVFNVVITSYSIHYTKLYELGYPNPFKNT